MAQGRGKTIVIIDDDEYVSGVLGGLLEVFGYPVKTYPSAQDFMAEASSIKTGCLVLDQNMPHMSGLDLVAKLSREHRLVPTVLITGMPDVDLLKRAKQLGVTNVLQKPMSHRDLLSQIEACLHA
jgi:two-component system, LuxR family, response regulator FixJ